MPVSAGRRGDNLLLEHDGSGALTGYTYYPGVDQPHSLKRDNSIHYYAQDFPGSVVGLIDSQGGLANEYRYATWGAVESMRETVPNALGFQAREWDEGTGMYYFRNRWYDPGIRRFNSEDPIGLAGGINLYAFTENNPVNFTDPLGLEPCSTAVITITALGVQGKDKCNGGGGGGSGPISCRGLCGNPFGPGGPSTPGPRNPGGGGSSGPTSNSDGAKEMSKPYDACGWKALDATLAVSGDLLLWTGGGKVMFQGARAALKASLTARGGIQAGSRVTNSMVRQARRDRRAAITTTVGGFTEVSGNWGVAVTEGAYAGTTTLGAKGGLEPGWKDFIGFIPGVGSFVAVVDAAQTCLK